MNKLNFILGIIWLIITLVTVLIQEPVEWYLYAMATGFITLDAFRKYND